MVTDKKIEVICKNKQMEFTDDKFKHTFFVKICKSDGFYNTIDVFIQDHLMFINKYDEGEKAVISVYWPYDYPVFIQLFDYFDTYSDVVDERAVEKAGWYDLVVDMSKEQSSFLKNNFKRKMFIEMSDDNINCLRRIEDLVKFLPDDVKKNNEKSLNQLHHINLRFIIDKDI